jgi:hypothetical protein
MIEYIQNLLQVVGMALALDPEIYRLAFEYTGSDRLVIFWVVFIGGLSLELGQSVVLFANRVKPGRFVISLLLGALVFWGRVLIVVSVVWAMANILGENAWPFVNVARGLGLAAAPYWFGFLILAPYAGLVIQVLIKGYVFIALLVALQAVFSISFWQAVLIALIAWLLAEIIFLVLSRLLTPLSTRLNKLIAGEEELQTARNIYEMFAKNNQIVH